MDGFHAYEMSGMGKALETERLRGQGKGPWLVTANRYRVPSGGVNHVLELAVVVVQLCEYTQL